MNFIYLKNESLSKEFCNDIISYFEFNKDKWYKGKTKGGVYDKIKDSYDLNIAVLLNDDKWKKIHEILYKELYENLKIYFENNNYKNYDEYEQRCQNILSCETFQIQKYDANKGKYIYHHDFDVDYIDKRVREITYLWYLNDVEVGGETEFTFNYKVKPTAGTLLIFPSTWTYLHRGNMPISNEKYILTGWMYRNY